MRFKIGRIPETAEAPAEDGWLKLREPPMWVTRLISLPLSLVLALIAALFVIRLTKISSEGLTGGVLIAVYVGTIAMHELIHASINPDRGLSDRTTLGFWPTRLVFFVYYEGSRSKRNHMLCLLAPFLLLSVLLLLASHYLGWNSFITMFGVPNSSQLQNRGWTTYWRATGSTVSSNQPLQPITREDARSG
jgi:putative zincin peptidase